MHKPAKLPTEETSIFHDTSQSEDIHSSVDDVYLVRSRSKNPSWLLLTHILAVILFFLVVTLYIIFR